MLGHFTQVDSIIPEPGKSQSFDRYAYSNNNPIIHTDQSGHNPILAIIAIGIWFILEVPSDTFSPNRQIPEINKTLGDAALRTIDPIDWVMTGSDCLQGNCTGVDIALSLTPMLNGSMDKIGDLLGKTDELVELSRFVDKTSKKPYSKPGVRPRFGPNQVETVWENAKQIDGNVYDPFTGDRLFWDRSISRKGQWDMGHMPGFQYKDLQKRYINGDIEYDNFIRQYRNPANYYPQSIKSNRSRKWDVKIVKMK